MRVGVLTSGGDAPGMNGAVRAVVRSALSRGWDVSGIRDGYAGLLARRAVALTSGDVGGILHRGGTVLGSARCPEFREPDGQRDGAQALDDLDLDALVIVGGNGSQAGAHALSELGARVVGVASTIDNDLYGTDVSIGVDTALNVALESVDRLKTTAASHRRAFLVEVMGRDCGYLALATAVAAGAEAVVVPEIETPAEAVAEEVRSAYARGNDHAVVIVAEGAHPGTQQLLDFCRDRQEELGFELRATIIGHVQRGGNPQAFDRLLSSRLGAAAVGELDAGRHGLLVGLLDGDVATTPLTEVVSRSKSLDPELLDLSRRLTR